MLQNITTRLARGYNLFAGVFAVALAAHGGTSLFTDGLQVQFRSDHDGRVVADTVFPVHGSPINSWTTEDGVASPLTLLKVGYRPNWQTNAFQRADGTFLPAVRFIRNKTNTGNIKIAGTETDITSMRLESTAYTTLNFGKETTWFLVMNNLAANNERGIFGFENEPRFGAFFLGSGDNQLRLHNNANPANSGNVRPEIGVAHLVDSRGTATRMTSGLDGSEAVNFALSSTARTSSARFYMGQMVGIQNSAAMDVAELAVYNRALNDAEVCIVRNALAARWGLTISNPLWTASAAGFCDDLVGIGSSSATGDGRIAGAVETSGNAGGLAFSVPSGSLAGTGGYLLMAHDGASLVSAWDAGSKLVRIPRVWRVQSTLAAMPAVTVAVDGATVAPGITGFACRLLYRADATQPFTDTGLTGVSSGTTVSFAFAPGAFKAGDYAVTITGGAASAVAAPGTEDITVWYSADAGVVTNEDGAVTNWVNQGSIGDVSDLHAYTGTVTVAENALTASDGVTTHNALRFATACLMTPGATSHGLAQNQLSSWFIVYEPSLVADEQKDAGLFGFNNNTDRYGAFFRTADGGYRINGYMGGYQASDLALADIPKAWHVADMTQYLSVEGATRGSLAVQGVTAKPAGNQSYKVQTTAKFKVGHFREDTWGKFFNGGIAELRIYKRPLNPIERLHVVKELSEKYGLAFNHPFWVSAETATATYRTEIQMTGLDKMAGTGGATGVMSGGLMISAGDEGVAASGIWYAHNGANLAWTTANGLTTLARSWYLCGDGTSMYAPFPAFRLNFLIGGVDDGSEYALYYRTDDTETWSLLPYTVDVACGTASVRVPAGLSVGYFTLGKVGTGVVAVPPCAAVRNGLAGWYRADTGVTTASGDVVSTWRNLGVLGEIADVTTAAGSPRFSTGVFARASGASEDSISFDGSSYMMTAKSLKWQNSDNNNTWFAVFKVQEGITPKDMGIVGNADGTTRFGAFFTGTHDLRTHGYVKNEPAKYCVVPAANFTIGQPMLIDSARAGNTVDSYLDGQHQDGKRRGDMDNSTSSQLMIGQMMSFANKFKGNFAEFRVYNRTLSDAERNIVANHLAARYGITMRDNLLYGGATDDCVLDVVGVGRTTANSVAPNTSNDGTVTNSWSVHVAGNITVSESSAGLTLAAAGTLANGDYVLAGHGEKANAWVSVTANMKRLKRAWHVTKTNAAALDLSLDFDLSDAGVALLDERDRPAYKLVRSLDGGATWEDVSVTLTQTGGGFSCILPAAEYAEGQYTLAADVLARGTMLIFR